MVASVISELFEKRPWHLPVLVLFLGLLLPHTAQAQVEDCDCINCPQFLPDLSNTDFYVEIKNATNQTMGQNGQGLCGVRVHFDHTALCDLRITLTAPSGQSVVLIGPSFKHPDCFYLCTQGTSWDVTFLPCGDPDVSPDPGFTEQWTNVQVWGTNNFFTGSYYPYQGCLQNLTGPVNGTWTLNVFDGLGADVGNLITFELIFCDPTGINCFNCVAEAGNLNQPDVVVCARSQAAVLSLPPTYTPPVFAPPPGEYSYGYIVSGANGVIEAILPEPDLSGLPEGQYTVCGLSYHNLAVPFIPAPDGVLTVQTLRDQLNALGPPFCGDVSVNCVGVRIKPTPEDVEETATICSPACYEFFDQIFCQSGTYVLNLKEDGCAYTATLHLTVNPSGSTTLTEVVCAPACSDNPLFPQACSTGIYTVFLENSAGCDSLVRLQLTVNTVEAAIQDPPPLDCGVPSVVLSGAGSSTGSGTTYQWTATQGGHLVGAVDSIHAVADSTGLYALQVCRIQAGRTCCDTAAVALTGMTEAPAAPMGIEGLALICADTPTTYIIPQVPGAVHYTWTAVPASNIEIVPSDTTVLLAARSAGARTLCVEAENACGSGPPACLTIEVQSVPQAPAVQGPLTVCQGDTVLFVRNSPVGAMGFAWSAPGGVFGMQNPSSDSLWVFWPDTGLVSVCATPSGSCGEGPSGCLDVRVLARPIAYAGMDTAVCGATLALSAGFNLPGSTGGWQSLMPGSAVVFSDSAAPGATATVPTAGVYRFAWREVSGICADTDTVEVVFNPLPEVGAAVVTCNDANTQYTVAFTVQQGSPPFAVPGGAFNGQVFTSDALDSGSPYAFTVMDALGCSAAPVQGIHSCICTSFAGQMDQEVLVHCAGALAVARHLGGSVPDGNDTMAYLLHSSSGTDPGVVYALQPSGVFGFLPGMQYGQTYYISLVVGNALNGLPDLSDPCLSVAPGQPVVFLEPPLALAGVDTAVCSLSAALGAAPGPFPGVWSVVSGPGNLSLGDPEDAGTTVMATAVGAYALVWTVSNGSCMRSDTLMLRFLEAPIVDSVERTCDGTNTTYGVTLEVLGGLPPFGISGLNGSFAGNIFASDPLPSGAAYNAVITDVQGCAVQVSGQYACDCTTFAGTLTAQDTVFCTNMPASALWNADAVLDAEDGVVFVLYTAAGGFPGTTLAVRNEPVFPFGPGVQPGVVYYIAAVAGDLAGGTVNLSDPCLSVSQGVPVRWVAPPVADAGADQQLRCDALEVALSASASVGADVLTWYTGGQPLGAGSTLLVRTPGLYVLIATNAAGCADTAVVEVTADQELPSVGAVLVTGETCLGEGDGSILLEDVGGPGAPFMASLNGGPFEDFLHFGSLDPGAYTVRIRSSTGCLWQSDTLVVEPGTQVTVSLGPDREVEPGGDVLLEAAVNGPVEAWLWEPLLDTAQAQSGRQRIRPEQTVLIRLRVRSPEGCEATDEVLIRVRAVPVGSDVYIPNVLQPGSALNDVFTVFAGPAVERIGVLQVFDRWGAKVFEAVDIAPNDPGAGWDGRIRGMPATPGVYVYQAVVRYLDGQERVWSGDVTVMW